MARELDVAAANFLIEEEMKREAEREIRDRKFWTLALGGKWDDEEKNEGSITLLPGTREPD